MSGQSSPGQTARNGLADALQGLRAAAAGPLDRDDLGRLAQMHTWCQTLAAAEPGPAPGSDAQAVHSLAATLATLLERLILGEAAQPGRALALIPEVAAAIELAHAGRDVNWEELLDRMGQAIDGGGAGGRPSPTASAAGRNDQPQPAGEPYRSRPLVLDLGAKEHLLGFVQESSEHIDAIERVLLEVEADPADTERLNELFRPFHTIKGIAGFLDLRDINRLTHEVETILDLGRRGELPITPQIIDLIFAAVDVLKTQVAELRQYLDHPGGGAVPQPEIAGILARLRAAAARRPDGAPAPAARGQVPAAGGQAAVEAACDARPPEPRQPGPAARRQSGRGVAPAGAAKLAPAEQSIRVDTAKLDALVDAVGELVIAQTMVSLNERVQADRELGRQVSRAGKIVRDVQETAMGMRMVPIGQTFRRLRRLVRDLARQADKRVELAISGEETELDKNVIQQISDPLVHMVRNAVDHGIEPPARRRAAGKPETGRLCLNAYHRGDSIAIEIEDDGRGLDRQHLLDTAVRRGLVAAGEQLSDQQVLALIMAPGFSTAEQVTDISGRGVGLDVVRRNIEQLRGKIEIASQKGRGTKFTVRLPLTLAIIDGMLVRVGRERMIVPTTQIEQSLRPQPRQITTVQRRGQMLQVRGELLPLIQLGPLFGYGPPLDPARALVVITRCEGHKLALVVDELIDQQQVVIKTLGQRFKGVRGVCGAAILGDGRVGLILEPAGVLALHGSSAAPLAGAERDSAARARPPGALAGSI